MAWKMRNRYPCPSLCTEHCYYEEVKVENGVCTVQREESYLYLLAIGYELLQEIPEHLHEEAVPTVVVDEDHGGGIQNAGEITPSPSPVDSE